MNKEIEAIKKSIEIINHNSTKTEESLRHLCKDVKQIKINHRDHLTNYEELRLGFSGIQKDIDWLKKLTWWILTTILMGTLLSILGGLVFLFLR